MNKKKIIAVLRLGLAQNSLIWVNNDVVIYSKYIEVCISIKPILRLMAKLK